MQPFKYFNIIPDYPKGFSYFWELSRGFTDPGPWKYRVYEGPSAQGPWIDISGEIDTPYYNDNKTRVINKDNVLYFKVKLITPKGEYETTVVTPYGDLDRKEFLIAREILRKERLHAVKLAGTSAQLWSVSTFGPECTKCKDPITGHIRDSKCKYCKGTGRYPAYYGPIDVVALFSDAQSVTTFSEDGTYTTDPRQYTVRVIGAPPCKTNDVIKDTAQGKMYYVQQAAVTAALRRVPIIQTLGLAEAPTSDIAYTL